MSTGKFLAVAAALALCASAAEVVTTTTGEVEGTLDSTSQVRAFKGIPYAAPPVGNLRWKAPQPAVGWTGVRKAQEFGSRCMQARPFADMVFRDPGISEDCLFMNVWTSDTSAQAKLPVMVWIYGGGFAAGAASEPRQDGGAVAKKGVVVASFNYRLGVFGFFSHPELTKESGHNASGNYGLLDQVTALKWVHDNIAAFGGDPGNVTVFGESAGSFSVSALMASPLAKGLFQRAIGESGAFFSASTLAPKTLPESEKANLKFAEALGASSIEMLRAKSADELLQAATKPGLVRFAPNIDGYFLPESVPAIFAKGKQSHVPLLAGWNATEGNAGMIFGKEPPTAAKFIMRAREIFGNKAEAVLKLYPAATDEEAKRSAQELAGDQFIAYSTWKWIEMQCATGDSPVFRYRFDQAPPGAPGAYHSAEIEFVFETLASKKLAWRPEDWRLSDLMSSYWTDFAKTGDPNASGLPMWPGYGEKNGHLVMHLSSQPQAAPDAERVRYELLDSATAAK